VLVVRFQISPEEVLFLRLAERRTPKTLHYDARRRGREKALVALSGTANRTADNGRRRFFAIRDMAEE
jgi:hypothetical protein